MIRGHSRHLLCVALLCLGLAVPARAAEDAKAVPRTGSPFEVEVTKDIAYHDGKDADPAEGIANWRKTLERMGYEMDQYFRGVGCRRCRNTR